MINILKKEKGFTLIELMIVVAIIGILAAIAIPQFSTYRVKAFNSAATSDMGTAEIVFENFFNDNSKYPNAVTVGTGTLTLTDGSNTASLTTSNKVNFGSKAGTGNQTYGAATKHDAGDKIYKVTSSAPTQAESSGTKGTTLAKTDVPAAP